MTKIIRRTHMYLALFLTPWMLMYALSTMAMNHREFFRKLYGQGPPVFEKERELTYNGTFPPGAKPKEIGQQILSGLGMEGAFGARMSPDGAKVIVNRQEPFAPKRLTFSPGDGKLVVEREVFRSPAFLERLHRRRGYQSDYPLEKTWAFSVDLVIAAMLFWAASGLWMWWEMKLTRRWGAAFGLAGLALFGLFLFTI
ncbi:MAG: hypothetical protein HY822_06655 [Acidobacteria bacterium]|nr:hypothetical protein [Acidobacteriota bacterium]